MIVIDETKLSQETLANILIEIGVDVADYWIPAWTEEEIQAMVAGLSASPKQKAYASQFEENVRITKKLDYERLFADKLDEYREG